MWAGRASGNGARCRDWQGRSPIANRNILRRVQDAVRYRLFRQSWNIAVTPYPIAQVAGLLGRKAQDEALDALCWMDEERALFRADPFPIGRRDGTGIDIYFEQLRWSEDRGTIDRVTYDGHKFGSVEPVMRTDHHLSYPYTVSSTDIDLVMPEQGEAGFVAAYNPDRGFEAPMHVLSEQPLVDASLIERNGRYWMFATKSGPNVNRDLYLFTADAISGPWSACQDAPVKSDLGSARPAGHMFEHDGELYRPSQNCADYYGENIVINRIVRLDEDGFVEEQVSEIRPRKASPYRDGLHTISTSGKHTVIDGARLISTFHASLDWASALVRQ